MRSVRRLPLFLSVVLALSVPAGAEEAKDAASVPRISQEEFKRGLDAGSILAIDVRGADVYRAGHIPGALLVPYDDLEGQAETLKAAKKTIVTYCS